MTWYAANVVMYVRFKDGKQDHYPVWENVVLLEANDEQEAVRKAEVIGAQGSGDSDGTMTWDDRPAEWCFSGVRKILTISNSKTLDNEPGDGAEISYSEFLLPDKEALEKFSGGQEVDVKYCE